MKKRMLFLLLCLFFVSGVSAGCSVLNRIENKVYDVDIKIEDLSKATVPAAEKASQAVIGVGIYRGNTSVGPWKPERIGSGVIYYAKAILEGGTEMEDIKETQNRKDVEKYVYRALTNEHIIASDALHKKTMVYLPSADILIEAKQLGKNSYEDLAVIEFETGVYLPPLIKGETEKLEAGEIVLAIGNPEGYDYCRSVTMGIVSHPQRYVKIKNPNWEGYSVYIQHDASINSGNSGGALVNLQGELIGINTSKLISKDESVEGIGFAIPVDVVWKTLRKMEKGEKIEITEIKGKLHNVNMLRNKDFYDESGDDSPEIPEGCLSGVIIGSLEEKCESFGLKEKDVITAVTIGNDKKIVNNVPDLQTFLRYYNGRDQIKWEVYRNGNSEIIDYNKE